MGYVEFFEMTPEGAGWKDLSELSFADSVELELSLMTERPKVLCWKCLAPIPSGTGNSCATHKDLKGSMYLGK